MSLTYPGRTRNSASECNKLKLKSQGLVRQDSKIMKRRHSDSGIYPTKDHKKVHPNTHSIGKSSYQSKYSSKDTQTSLGKNDHNDFDNNHGDHRTTHEFNHRQYIEHHGGQYNRHPAIHLDCQQGYIE